MLLCNSKANSRLLRLQKTFAGNSVVYFLFFTCLSCGRKENPKVDQGNNDPSLRLSDLPQGIFQLMKDPAAAGNPIAKASLAIAKLERISGVIGSAVFFKDPYHPSAPPLLMTNAHVLGFQSCLQSGCAVRLHTGQEKDSKIPALSIWVHLVPYAFSDTVPQPTAALKTLQALDAAVFQVFEDPTASKAFVNPYALTLADSSPSGNDSSAGNVPNPSSKAMATLSAGDTVTLVGSPLGYLKKAITGKLAAKGSPYLNAEMLTLPGTSGGAILNQNGDFLALHHKGTQSLEYLRNNGYFGVSLSTGVNALLELLKEENRTASLSMFTNAKKVSTLELFSEYSEALLTSAEDLSEDLRTQLNTQLPDQKQLKLEMLWQVCEGLEAGIEGDTAASDQASAENLCLLAALAIRCNPLRGQVSTENPYANNTASFQVCPEGDQKEKWLKRFAAKAQALVDEQSYFWSVSAPLRFESSAIDSGKYKAAAQALFEKWYTQGPKQRRVTDALHSLDSASNPLLGGEDTTPWFKSFRDIPNYYYQYPNFLRGLFLLTKLGKLSTSETRSLFQNTESDKNATLLDKLLSDFLDWRLKAQIQGDTLESPMGLP